MCDRPLATSRDATTVAWIAVLVLCCAGNLDHDYSESYYEFPEAGLLVSSLSCSTPKLGQDQPTSWSIDRVIDLLSLGM